MRPQAWQLTVFPAICLSTCSECHNRDQRFLILGIFAFLILGIFAMTVKYVKYLNRFIKNESDSYFVKVSLGFPCLLRERHQEF